VRGAGLLIAALVANSIVSAEPLRVFGNTTTIELAPVLLAAQRLGPDAVTLTNGGIGALYDDKSSSRRTSTSRASGIERRARGPSSPC
jgi:hypothetical protein